MSEKSTSRHRIMEAAEVIFAEKGYHATAVDEIASRTNISKGGVYFHFPSKERLFFAVLDHLADRLAHRIQTDVAQKSNALDRLEISLATVLESLSKRKSLAKLMLIQGYSMGNAFEKKRIEIYSRFAEIIKQDLDLAIDQDLIPPINTNVASHIWLGAINEVLIRWLYEGEPSPTKEALPVLKRLLLNGIGADNKVSVGG